MGFLDVKDKLTSKIVISEVSGRVFQRKAEDFYPAGGVTMISKELWDVMTYEKIDGDKSYYDSLLAILNNVLICDGLTPKDFLEPEIIEPNTSKEIALETGFYTICIGLVNPFTAIAEEIVIRFLTNKWEISPQEITNENPSPTSPRTDQVGKTG